MKIILSNILRNVLLASYLSAIVIGLIKIFLKQEFVIFSLPDILLILGLAILNEEKTYLKIGKLKESNLLESRLSSEGKVLWYFDFIGYDEQDVLNVQMDGKDVIVLEK